MTAIVTGGGRGLGRQISVTLARDGARVVLVARTRSELEATAEEIRAVGGEALVCPGDVSDLPAMEAVVDEALAWGDVELVVNNAGSQQPIGVLTANDPEAWARTVRVNLLGALHLCRLLLPHLIERGGGRIVNVSGGGAANARPYFSAYAASKAAVARFTETLAEELRGSGVQVNAIAPGAMNTRMLDEILASGVEREIAEAQLVSGGTPLDVPAGLVRFLATCSPAITGKLIAAPHDDWQSWDGDVARIAETPLLTLRRVDPFTVGPLLDTLQEAEACASPPASSARGRSAGSGPRLPTPPATGSSRSATSPPSGRTRRRRRTEPRAAPTGAR
ncbi:MAG TPA: SDR family oxidoreductase [Gaiellaceae bacterium]|nr:SDR family oxidoreductase [Gaiellaceae bacterium]